MVVFTLSSHLLVVLVTILILAPGHASNQQSNDPETVGNMDFSSMIHATNNTKRFQANFKLAVNSSKGSDIMVQTDVASMSSTSDSNAQQPLGGVNKICNGHVLLANPDTDEIQQTDVVFIPCDDPGYAGQVLSKVASANPACTIMYSIKNQACNMTDGQGGQNEAQLGTIFTLLSNVAGKSILSRVNGTFQGDKQDHSVMSAVVSPHTSSPKEKNNSSSTVAMAVLYSVTGVVAAAFLFVIISGAIRVHQHPERYGLQPAGGGSSSSNNNNNSSNNGGGSSDNDYAVRAKGLARAVLDSIPLVTFQVDKTHKDNESQVALESVSPEKTYDSHREDEKNQAKAVVQEEGDTSAETCVEPSEQDVGCLHGREEDEETCPVCFEQFKDGEILRVLPCKHKFHAICVDPWLLNSSSHCPLCRVDLSLQRNEHVSESPPDEDPSSSSSGSSRSSEIVIPPGYQVETSMFNRFLDVWNAQLLPKESRRAVLHQFQQEAEIRRQLRQQRNEQQLEQNRNLWRRFVASRRLLHQTRFGRHNNNSTGESHSQPDSS